MADKKRGTYPRNYWKGFAILLISYTLLQLVYYIPTESLPGFLKRLPMSPVWLLLVVVYATGAWILRSTGVAWLNAVWHLVHLVLIAFSLSVLVYGRLLGPVQEGISASIRPILEFMISPVLYLALGLLYRTAK